jgi:hypothetical protein
VFRDSLRIPEDYCLRFSTAMSAYYDIQPLSSCPGPKFLVGQQLRREQVTDDMRRQAAMEMYLIEQEIVVLSQLQVIKVSIITLIY